MRSVLVGACVLAAVASTACSNDSGPTDPSNDTTIRITANSASQSFTPNPAQSGGQMVVWRNDHGETHRIVANDGSFDTGDLAPGETSSMVQITASGLNYHCEIHPTMVGGIGTSGGGAPPPCSVYC